MPDLVDYTYRVELGTSRHRFRDLETKVPLCEVGRRTMDSFDSFLSRVNEDDVEYIGVEIERCVGDPHFSIEKTREGPVQDLLKEDEKLRDYIEGLVDEAMCKYFPD